jgi:hypothetical protein
MGRNKSTWERLTKRERKLKEEGKVIYDSSDRACNNMDWRRPSAPIGRTEGIFPLLRQRGFRALSMDEPPPRTQLAAALHLTRDDRGDDAHRSILDDTALEHAFLDAGYATFGRCCDWNAPSASRAAVVAVARADVIVGMHGAAMTHLLFAKPRAVAVEIFSGTLISLRKGGGLWFFARYTKGYYGKIFLRRGPRQERSTLDAVQAARTVRCASEASAGPRARRPSCDK